VALSEALARVTGRKPARIAAQPTPGGKTFKEVAESHIKQHEPSWKSAVHARQWATTLEDYAYDIIGHKLPGDVTTADVIAIFKQPVKDRKKKPIAGTSLWNTQPENASRIRGRIEKIIAAWKVESGQQDKFNPATWAGHLQAVFPKKSKLKPVEHHAALPWAEVPALMAELVARADGPRGGGVSALALRFLILTAGRTNEVIGSRWNEIGYEARLWSIPKERMKMGKGHVVPLSDAALAVLATANKLAVEGNAAIFPGGTYQKDGVITLSNMAMLTLLERLAKPREKDGWALTKEVTVHGFRSSFRDWAADNGYDRELAEAALAHTVGGVEGAYRRSPMVERRAPMMAAWAAHCMSQDGSGKVVALAGRRKAPARREVRAS
jgi:integrase